MIESGGTPTIGIAVPNESIPMQALRSIYQLKITLEHIEPAIWRRVLVLSSTELRVLHEIVQGAMGWTNCHLHQFLHGKSRYGQPDPEFPDDTIDEQGIRIASLLKAPGERLLYEYDFGDGWTHAIVLEEVLPFTPGTLVPLCVGGERSCPPENVGGPPGYEHFLGAYHDPEHPEHEDIRQWARRRFNPEKFDAGAVNRKLAKVKA